MIYNVARSAHSPQSRHPSLQLSDSGATVCVISDESFEPAAKLVLLLDDVVGDGTATVCDRLVPPEFKLR